MKKTITQREVHETIETLSGEKKFSTQESTTPKVRIKSWSMSHRAQFSLEYLVTLNLRSSDVKCENRKDHKKLNLTVLMQSKSLPYLNKTA